MSYEQEDLYWIEVRMMKRTKHHPKPEMVIDYASNEDGLGFIKDTFKEVVEELTEAIK